MKVGILILVRLGSKRLKNKHLIEVNGITFLNYLIYRFHNYFKEYDFKIIIATSDKPENKYLEQVINSNYASIYYGSDRNIPLRQYDCAVKYGLTHIISVDGDDIFCSTRAALDVFNKMKNGSRGAKTSGLPIGLNIMGYETKMLKDIINENNKLGGKVFETGWGRVFDNKLELIKIDNINNEYFDKLRFTLDYKDDELFFEQIINKYPGDLINAKDEDIIDFVIKNKLYKINMHLKELYNNNFETQKQNEILENER